MPEVPMITKRAIESAYVSRKRDPQNPLDKDVYSRKITPAGKPFTAESEEQAKALEADGAAYRESEAARTAREDEEAMRSGMVRGSASPRGPLSGETQAPDPALVAARARRVDEGSGMPTGDDAEAAKRAAQENAPQGATRPDSPGVAREGERAAKQGEVSEAKANQSEGGTKRR